jgi:hypothetical protein
MRLDRFLLCCSLSALACASASESRVKPGDACRVYLLGRDGSVTLELANKACANARPDVDQRTRQGVAKVAGDAEMIGLIDQLESVGFFANAIQTAPATGRTCLVTEVASGQWSLIGGAVSADTARTFGESLSALQNAFNDAFTPHARSDGGAELFEAEKRRLEEANREALKRGGKK